MHKLENGNIYLEKGEAMPYKCPACGALICFSKEKTEQIAELMESPGATGSIICDCGYKGTAAEFSDVEYTLRKPN